jgi:hypothetical protein
MRNSETEQFPLSALELSLRDYLNPTLFSVKRPTRQRQEASMVNPISVVKWVGHAPKIQRPLGTPARKPNTAAKKADKTGSAQGK